MAEPQSLRAAWKVDNVPPADADLALANQIRFLEAIKATA